MAQIVVTPTRFSFRYRSIRVYILAESNEYARIWAKQTVSSGNIIKSQYQRKKAVYVLYPVWSML